MTVAVLFFALSTNIPQSVERAAYDWGVRNSSSIPASNIAIIAIDEASIASIGRWPWSRHVHAQLIDFLSKSDAEVIAYTALFLEEQVDPGLNAIRNILDYYVNSNIAETASNISNKAQQQKIEQSLVQLETMLFESEASLNTDLALQKSIENAGNVVLPMLFRIATPLGNPDQPLPDYIRQYAVDNFVDNGNAISQGQYPVPADTAYYPIPAVGVPAAGIGHLTAYPDIDGSIRSDPLFINYYQSLYPSLALTIAANSLNLGPGDVQAQLGEGVRVGNLNIATDAELQMNTFFYNDQNGQAAFPLDSFYDVITDKVSANKYAGKIVLIGAIAGGIGAYQVTPIDSQMPPVVALAHSVSSILNEDFFVQPSWHYWVTSGVFATIACYLLFVIPALNAGVAATISVLILGSLIGTHFILMTTQSLWIPLTLPALLLVFGHLTITTKRFLATERGKQHSDAESAESNRMLGLAFQGQGQLDMAFDKLRKCPLDDSILEILYNLGLDYERKRQFSKAGEVFHHMKKHNTNYRDISKRIKRAENMENTVMLSTGAGSTGAHLLLDTEGIEKPKLGRYEVETELGKGAMGIVYKGQDPKIGRIVAIKTLALAQEFEEDELEDVKQRFFAKRKLPADSITRTLSLFTMLVKSTTLLTSQWSFCKATK